MSAGVVGAACEGAGGAGADKRGARCPRAVTRGESQHAGTAAADRSKVDWLSSTFSAPELSVEGLVGMLGKCIGRPTWAVDTGRGMSGFESRVALHVYVGAVSVECGSVALGGAAQRGRWMLQLTGRGCGLVRDWSSLRELLEGLDARLTRVDLAVDFLAGEHTVDDAVQMHRDGGFSSNGRPPSTSVVGDWLEGVHGRTLNVGKAGNGKTLCVYEKGKQLGDLGSPWVRFEVRLGNRDREIPFDVLTEPDGYFCGAYPALEPMLAAAAEAIPTSREKAKTTLSHLLFHLRRCYGKPLHQALENTGATHAELIEEMRVIGMPRRLDPAGITAGLTWAQLRANLKRLT